MARPKALKRVLVIIALLTGIIFSVPRRLEICPPWEIIVTDQEKRPKEGVQIWQGWDYYGISTGNSTTATTDANGRVRFPARHVKSPPILTALQRAVTLLAVHSSFGPSASIGMSAPQSKRLKQLYYHGKFLGRDPHVASSGNDPLETTFVVVKWDLLEAVDAGNFTLAAQILKDNPGAANMRNILGGTALFSLYSLKAGSIDFAKLLIAAGCDVKAADHHSKTALHWAAERGQVELATLFLENGADVMARIRNPQGVTEDLDTPLHSAVHSTQDDATVVSMVALLVQHGADVNARARFDETPLHLAAYLGSPAVIKELRARGAKTGVKTSEDKTPMDYAMKFNKSLNIQALR